MNELFARFFGALTRFLLAGIAGWFVKKGIIDDNLSTDLLAAAVIGIPTLIWSLYQKYKDRVKFLTALQLPVGSTESDVEAVVDNGGARKLSSLILVFVLLGGGLSMACGKEQIENTVTKTVVALRAARKVTTVQHKYGHIDDKGYGERLTFFGRAYTSVDALGDTLADFGEINTANKQDILDKVNELAGTIDQLIAKGDVGVLNPQTQADYRRWLTVARAGINAIKIGVAAVEKPIPVKDLKIPKASG